jgi:hypothetical protein
MVARYDGERRVVSGWISHTDARKPPHEIEWELGGRSEFSGRFEPKYAQKGIYEVGKDARKLRATRDATQTPRPKAFESPEGKELVLQEFVRVK